MSETATVSAPQAPASAPDTSTNAPEVKAVETKEAGTEQKAGVAAPGDKKPEGSLKEGEVKKDPAPSNPDKPFVLKVDGKEIHLSKEDAIRWAQKGMGIDKKLTESQKKVEVAETFIRMLRENPEAILMNPQIMGQEKFRKLAQDYLHKEIQKEMMTPEQRELAELKEKLAQEEQARKEIEEKTAQERQSELVKHYNAQYEKDITDTLATSGLPKTRSTVKRLAYYMSEGLKRGVELKAADVVDLVRADYQAEHAELFGQLDGDTLANFLGENTLKKIREAELKRLNNPQAKPEIKKAEPVDGGNKAKKKMTKDEFNAYLEKVAKE